MLRFLQREYVSDWKLIVVGFFFIYYLYIFPISQILTYPVEKNTPRNYENTALFTETNILMKSIFIFHDNSGDIKFKDFNLLWDTFYMYTYNPLYIFIPF